MHKTFLIVLLSSVTAFAQGRSVTDEAVVDYVVRRADSSSTLTEFVKTAVPIATERDEMLAYLAETGEANSRLGEVFGYSNMFIVDLGDDVTVIAEYISKPRPQLKLANRVIYLDRATKDVVREVNSILHGKVSLMSIAVPPAHAFFSSLGSWLGIRGKAAATQASAVSKAETASLTVLGDEFAEIREDMQKKKYSVECKDPADFKFTAVNIQMPDMPGSPLRNVRMEGFDGDANKFKLKLGRHEGDRDPQVFNVNLPESKISAEKRTTFLAAKLAQLDQEDADARKASQPAKKAAPKKGAKQQRGSAATSAQPAQKPSMGPPMARQMRLLSKIMPDVAYKKIMSCCAKDFKKCNAALDSGKGAPAPGTAPLKSGGVNI